MQRHSCLRWFLVVGAFLAGAGLAHGQGKAGSWEILVAYERAAKPKASPRIALRPNVSQPVYIYLKNAAPLPKKNVTLSIVRLLSVGKEQVLGQTKFDKVPASQTQLAVFKQEPPPKTPPVSPPDEGPPFQFQIWLQEGEKEVVKVDLPVTIQQPHEYVHVDAPLFDKKRNRLSVRLEVNADSAEPPCQVELVLDPEVIPGLIRPQVGLFKDKLNSKNREVELFADNIQFVQGVPPKNARVYVTVDGYERAFMFKTAFEQGSLRPLSEQTRVRVKAPRYFNPALEEKLDPKADKGPPRLVLNFEADGIADPDKRLEVAYDRSGEGKFIIQRTFPGLREQAIGCAPGPDGSLLFRTLVRDWKMELDPTVGRKSVRLRVVGVGDKPLPLADEQNQKDEAVLLFSKSAELNAYAPLEYNGLDKAVYAAITVDATAPEGVKLVELPPEVLPGIKLRLKAVSKKRDPLDQTPIGKVVFYVGDPAKGPPLAGVYDAEKQVWLADAVIPADAKDKLAVAVQFTTVTGLSARDTGTIAIAVPKVGVLVVTELTQITGKVLSLFTQKGMPGIEVVLKEKGQTKATAKTDDSGAYKFSDVNPGSYTVTATQPGVQRGTAAVTALKGKIATADISMKRIQ